MADLSRIADDLSSLTVMEAAELAKMLEEKWGVSAAAPVVQTGPANSGPAQEAVAEKTEFDAMLVSYGAKKLDVVKTIRPLTGLDLKSAMTFVNNVDQGPAPIKVGISKEEAEKIKREIEGAGGTVEIR